MVTEMCERQTSALNAVVDRADFLEDMAMGCAVCTDPWARPASTSYERKEKRDKENRHSNYGQENRHDKENRHSNYGQELDTMAGKSRQTPWRAGAGRKQHSNGFTPWQ